MSTSRPSTLYATPFSRAYWRDAAGELKNVRILVFAALMIALRVALKSLGIPIAADLRINIAFFINAFGAMVFGPVVAILCAAISDTLGCLLFPVGPYFFPFVFIEIAGSLIFALFLYRTKLTASRVILSRFCICFFVNILLNTPVMWLYYKLVLGKSYLLFQVPRIVKNLALFPLESVLLILFLRLTAPLSRRMGLSFSDTEGLKFDRKTAVLTAVLLVLGAGLVSGYAIDHYNTTSLSASWSPSERYAENCAMNEQVLAQNSDWDKDATVSIVESVFPKFGKDTLTYTVAVYAVDEAALAKNAEKARQDDPDARYDMDTLRGYSKSKAAKDSAMTRLATVTIVAEKSTGAVQSLTTRAAASGG